MTFLSALIVGTAAFPSTARRLQVPLARVDYYFDCNARKGGDGSESFPLRDLEDISPREFNGMAGVSINLKRGCMFTTSAWTDILKDRFESINGFKLTAYGDGEPPVVSGSRMGIKGKCLNAGEKKCKWHYAWAFNGVSDLSVSHIHFKDAPLLIEPSFAQTTTGFHFEDCDFTESRHEAVRLVSGGRDLAAEDKNNFRFKDIMVKNCRFRRNAHHNFRVLGRFHYADKEAPRSENVVVRDSLFEYTTSPQGAGVVVSSCKDVLIENNLFNHMNGSGFWSVRTHGAVVRNNFFANSARKHDACTNHVDLGNYQTLFHHNVGYNNEGGFLEVLGYSNSTWSKYSVSINDGIDLQSNGLKGSGVFTLMFSGFGGTTEGMPRQSGVDTYVTNNLIVSQSFQNYKFLDDPKRISLVNNMIYVPGSQSLTVQYGTRFLPDHDTKQDRVLESNTCLGGSADAGLLTLQGAFSQSKDNVAEPDIPFDDLSESLVSYMKDILSVPLGRVWPAEIRQEICKRIAAQKSAYEAAMGATQASTPSGWPGDQGFAAMKLGEDIGAEVKDFCGQLTTFPFAGPLGMIPKSEN